MACCLVPANTSSVDGEAGREPGPPWESPVSPQDEGGEPGAWASPHARPFVQTPILLPGRPWPKLGNLALGLAQVALWLRDKWGTQTSGEGP